MVIPDYKLRDKISVKVFDIMGKVVYEQAISTDILTIDIERWTSGVFTYVIDHNSQNHKENL
ncbi:MAG: T9SS type A sorting domain-containing protein [Saprospiraceae bacterium]|nr:T9SS type A sorting domain-containing protein [Saprospiraceae bacterium]